MHVVAIHSINKDKETLAGALAMVLKVTIYEALTRLRAPGNGPLIVAVLAEKERAEQLVQKLHSAGFKAVGLTAGEIDTAACAWIVRRFSLGERELHVETEKGDNLDISFQDINLVLRGIRISRSTTTKTVKERSVDLGRAVLSGGMMITKTTKTTQDVTTEARERFVDLYAGDAPAIVFREDALDYNSLGSARKPSRSENFTYLVAELRRCCPGVQYDERLMNRAAQASLLGPFLNPEEHLVVATALLAKVLRETI
jgi:NACalpha-BTF3-like transcription factor